MNWYRIMQRLYAKVCGRPILPAGIRIGKDVWIGDATRFDWDHGRHITIGDEVTLAPGVRILCHDASCMRRVGGTWIAPVTIHARAFIGAESIIMPGVVIGEGAIVAAGAVVTREVLPGTIVAGVPARQIGLVADLDTRRREQMLTKPQFRIADYEPKEPADLPAAKDLELRQAVEKHGGYFLV